MMLTRMKEQLSPLNYVEDQDLSDCSERYFTFNNWPSIPTLVGFYLHDNHTLVMFCKGQFL